MKQKTVKRLFVDGDDAKGGFPIEDSTVRECMNGDYDIPLHTAPTYLHEWWLQRQQFARDGVKRGHEICHPETVCIHEGMLTLLNLMRDEILQTIGYNIETDEIAEVAE